MEKAKRLGLPGELAAEFAGTMILILFGVGVVAQVVSGGSGGGLGGHDSIAWAWGLGVMFGIYVAGRVTGAHLNPAVTFAFAIFRGFSWRKVLPYTLAQTAGAFVAALIVPVELQRHAQCHRSRTHNGDSDDLLDDARKRNAPGQSGISADRSDHRHGDPVVPHRCGDRYSGNSAARESCALRRRFDRGGNRIPHGRPTRVTPSIPARDFGPRLASYLTGYGSAWRDQYGSLYFWVPIVGPLIGAPIGVFLYDKLIGRFLPDESVEKAAEEPATIPALMANHHL